MWVEVVCGGGLSLRVAFRNHPHSVLLATSLGVALAQLVIVDIAKRRFYRWHAAQG